MRLRMLALLAVSTALLPWAVDVIKHDLDALTRKCWTVPPAQIEPMTAIRDG